VRGGEGEINGEITEGRVKTKNINFSGFSCGN
jgi:hypothetical protein